MQKAMNFKRNQVVRIVVAVGYPKENDPIRKKIRKPLDNTIVHH